MEFAIETENDLQKLIGQYESIRLDFKASALLSQPTERIKKQLTEDASSFANTEGGVIVIGISESKSGKKSVAAEIDEGIDPAHVTAEWLEQVIASNISPPIPGLRVHPIPLSGSKEGRMAYVVTVPKGSTAYQARHSLLYYGRTEFAAVPLHDNVIRLLMIGDRVANATIELANVSRLTSEDEYARRQSELIRGAEAAEHAEAILARLELKRQFEERRSALEAPKRAIDEYGFDLAIRNSEPSTIKDCLLSVSLRGDLDLQVAGRPRKEGPWLFDFSAANRIERRKAPIGPELEKVSEIKLFPEHLMSFPGARLTWNVPTGQTIPPSTLVWKLYLDEAPSRSGLIDLARELPALAAPIAS